MVINMNRLYLIRDAVVIYSSFLGKESVRWEYKKKELGGQSIK